MEDKHIRKEKVELFTDEEVLKGYLHVEEGFRLKDFLNALEVQFFPLTEVEVFTRQGKRILKSPFICVNKNKIVLGREGG